MLFVHLEGGHGGVELGIRPLSVSGRLEAVLS
jgi:hypothetical protein